MPARLSICLPNPATLLIYLYVCLIYVSTHLLSISLRSVCVPALILCLVSVICLSC
jgi:hypothetical protein